jgi:hypothetical protein
MCDGIRGVTLPKGAPFGIEAATLLAAEAAVDVISPTRAVKGMRTEEHAIGIGRPVAGGTEFLEASDHPFGFPIAPRCGEDPELEAGAADSPVMAAISKCVACRVEVARLIIGLEFR